ADRVQECHITIGHVMIDLVERMLGYYRLSKTT
ncbi:MAG: phosphoheptose isomerase, partial [Chlorobiaceae bacterium]|nr:phosphoheptose isomerase [Chlorobiaceae bacterium]